MQRSDITTVNNITQAIANPAAGDVIFLDIDETLLLTGFKKFSDDPKITEPGLPAEILRLQERGIRVVGLTSRSRKKSQATLDQLKLAGIQLEVLHAPDIKSDDGSLHSGKGKALHAYLELGEVKPKRIFVFDNLLHHLEAVKAECESLGIPLFLKHYIVPDFKPVNIDAESNAIFPEKLDGFQKEKALGGGTASVFSIKHSERDQSLVLKLGAHEDGAKVEMLCNAVYRVLGVDVPKMRVYHTLPKKLAKDLGLKNPYRFSQVCEYIKSGDAASADIIKKAARDHFVVHALLGNIDVAKEDNFIVDQHGKAYLIDAGANFLFRSLGKKRKEAPQLVSEMETLRDKSFNDKGPVWFGDLTDEEIGVQLQDILARNKELTEAVWNLSRHLQLSDELRDKFLQCLADRIDALVMRYLCHPQGHAKVDKRAEEGKTAAGILTYTIKDGEPHILLSRRVRHEWWDNFGGKSEANDDSLLSTARREVAEESGQLLNYTDLELLNSPFHDIVTGKRGRDQHLYRMYISQYDYVNESEFKDKEHTAHQWVPLKDILASLDAGEYKEFEGQNTVVVKSGNVEIPLYPPLFNILQQLPVLENLRELQRIGQMKRRATLSYAENIGNIAPAGEYRPLLTPVEKRQQIAATLERKSRVIRELKREYSDTAETVTDSAVKRVSGLSQSEMHLKAMLGAKYKDNNLAANVRKFIKKDIGKLPALSDQADVERLVQHSVALIAKERLGGDDNIYFYHACSNSIAFAYDVYTAIYQALQQDARWSAFRPDSVYFKQFMNINEFVAFYSKQGTQEISNNDANYNDCALSANVFLFGNHAAATSCSIHYLLNNDVRRQVDMAALFEELLRPFHVTTGEIRRIQALFEVHLREQGGRLYQIAMPTEQARQMAYPAGYLGVMKKLNGDHELPSVLQKLRAQVEGKDSVSTITRDYIKLLQARVMVPPHLKLATTEVKWKPMSVQAEAAYRKSLTKVADALVHKILCHHGADNGRDSGASLLKVLPDILQSNQLAVKARNNDEALVKAILADDVVTVKNILHDRPELLQKKVLVKRNYIESGHGNRAGGDVTFLRMILQRNKIPLASLIDFSNDGWIKLLSSAGIKDYRDLKQILKILPEERRAVLAMHHAVLMDDSRHIVKIIGLLPLQDRMRFVNINMACIRKCHRLCGVASLLPKSDALMFLKNNLVSAIVLVQLLNLLPEEQRMDVVNEHLDLIESADFIIRVINLVPAAMRLGFAARCQNKITNSEELSQVLICLDQSDRLTFASLHSALIKEGRDLCCVLKALPEQARIEFARLHQTAIGNLNYLYEILSLLPDENSFEFALANIAICEGNAAISSLIKLFDSPAQRYALAMACQSAIMSGSGFTIISEFLDKPDVLAFLSANMRNAQHLKYYLGLLPKDQRGAAVVKYKNCISENDDLPQIVTLLPVSQRSVFVTDNQHLIKSIYDLVGLMKLLTSDDNLQLATSMRELIKHDYELVEVLEVIDVKYRLSFALEQRLEISDGMQLREVAVHLDNNQRLSYVTAKIVNASTLVYALSLVADQEVCLDMVECYRHLIVSGRDVGMVVKVLPLESRLVFANTHSHKINNTCDIASIISQLPAKDRLDFAMSCMSQVTTFDSCSSIGQYLTASEMTVFLRANIKCCEILVMVLEMTEPSARLALAQRHANLLTSYYDLDCVLKLLSAADSFAYTKDNHHRMTVNKFYTGICDILKYLTPDEILEIANLNQGKITDQSQLNFIIRHLPGASQLAFRKANISNAGMLSDYLKLLPEDERLAAATEYQHVITNYHDLRWILTVLSLKDRWTLAVANQHKSQADDDLEKVAEELIEKERMPFMLNNVKTGKGVACILRKLPDDERLAFANYHLENISNTDELCSVAFNLLGRDRHDFVMANQAKINSMPGLAALTLMIKKEFRITFIMAHQDKICDASDLARLAVMLEGDMQKDFIFSHQDKIKSVDDLIRVMRCLDTCYRRKFVTNHQHKIRSMGELLRVVTELDEDDGRLLTIANFYRIKDVNFQRGSPFFSKGFFSKSGDNKRSAQDTLVEFVNGVNLRSLLDQRSHDVTSSGSIFQSRMMEMFSNKW